MTDLRQYSDRELSLVIFNDEFLYKMRHKMTKDLLDDMGIKFNDAQWQEFQDDLKDEE